MPWAPGITQSPPIGRFLPPSGPNTHQPGAFIRCRAFFYCAHAKGGLVLGGGIGEFEGVAQVFLEPVTGEAGDIGEIEGDGARAVFGSAPGEKAREAARVMVRVAEHPAERNETGPKFGSSLRRADRFGRLWWRGWAVEDADLAARVMVGARR